MTISSIIESFFRREADRFRVQAAVLYGSWAGGFPRRDSDVDVARKLIEEQGFPAVNLGAIGDSFEYPLIVGT